MTDFPMKGLGLMGNPGMAVDVMRQSAPARNLSSPQNVEQAAEQFEASFIAQMLAPMFEGIETDGMFGGGHAEEMWRGVLIDEMAKKVAEAGGIGVSDAIRAELIAQQARMQAAKEGSGS